MPRSAFPLLLVLLPALGLTAAGCSDPPGTRTCSASSECGRGEECIDGLCQPSRRPDGSVDDGGHESDGGARPDAGPEVLVIDPIDPVVETDGTPMTLQLHARIRDTEPTSVTWLLDDVVVGTVSPTGLFTARGLVAGRVVVTARYGTLEASTTITVRVRATQGLADVAPALVDSLRAGGASDADFRWLYPYDGTVFPRGLGAPTLQLGGEGADATRVTLDVESVGFHYEGFFAATTPIQIALPRAVWDGATRSTVAGAPIVVGVTKVRAGRTQGPVTEQLHIAQGELTGSVYYNSYDSRLAGGGAILRVPLGEDAQVVQGGCTVCHSVSANGSRIATGLSWSGTDTITGTGNPIRSGTIDLDASGGASAGWTDPDGRRYSFAALTPDGAWALNNAIPPDNRIRGLSGVTPSRLWDARTGAEIPAPSFTDAVSYAITPQFAPDASALAFSWFRDSHPDNGRVLTVMSFDGTMSPPLFGAPRAVVAITDAGRIVGWPSFTPDGGSVIYQEGGGFDTSSMGPVGASNLPIYADLRLVDLGSCDAAGERCAVSTLDRLNGYLGGAFDLPYGEAEEGHSNYEPTVLPVAVGGYYWVVFTSRRAYGNTIAPGGSMPGGDDRWGHRRADGAEIASARKKLWVAAIDLTGAPGTDRSHPPFYLTGQELESGNMRGFAALDPCRADGETCDSAADCCGGFCRTTGTGEDGAPVLECVPRPEGCAMELEACTVAADCCGATAGVQCINNRCAQPPLM